MKRSVVPCSMSQLDDGYRPQGRVERAAIAVGVIALWIISACFWFRDDTWRDPFGTVLLFAVPALATIGAATAPR